MSGNCREGMKKNFAKPVPRFRRCGESLRERLREMGRVLRRRSSLRKRRKGATRAPDRRVPAAKNSCSTTILQHDCCRFALPDGPVYIPKASTQWPILLPARMDARFSAGKRCCEFARFLTTPPLRRRRLALAKTDRAVVDAKEATCRGVGFATAEKWARGGGCGAGGAAPKADTRICRTSKWDLWGFDIESLQWQHKPEPLVLTCHGQQYDEWT